MCCSMTCWDCMIMQDSDIIVSSRPNNEEFGQIKWLKYWLCEVSVPRHTPILRQTMQISMSEK